MKLNTCPTPQNDTTTISPFAQDIIEMDNKSTILTMPDSANKFCFTTGDEVIAQLGFDKAHYFGTYELK